jgi:alcohol dehydrogenase class IV
MVIAHTGTTIVHGMGYSLTYFKGIAHGRANGMLMKEYLNFNYDYAGEKIDKMLKMLRIKNIEEFGTIIDALLRIKKGDIKVNYEEIKLYAERTMKSKSTTFNIRDVKEEDLIDILRKSVY